MRASVIGLGKLGAPLAAVLASKGFDVVGVDTDTNAVAALKEGRAPVTEPGLQDRIDCSRHRLTATTEIGEAISRTDVTFVIVPTPSGPDGTFTNEYVVAAMREIGAALRTKISYHLVVVTSTVTPGSTQGPIREALEAAAGRPVGDTIGLCYSPEFIALGTVIRDMLNPDFVLIGELDRRSGDMLEGIYRAACDNNPTVQRMNFINAELTKIAVNTYVTTKISFANMLADICDHMPGADAMVVSEALGCDSRIGAKYLRPGLGYGGPCFPRDNVALAAMARRLNVSADIAEATDRVNRHQPERVVRLVRRLLPRGTVGVLGLSYKPGSSVVEESQAVDIAALLAKEGYRVVVYDPEGLKQAMAELGGRVEASEDAEDCAAQADLLIIATPWPAFRDLPPDTLRRPDGRRLPVIDCWRLLPADEFGHVAELVYLGQDGRAAAVGEPRARISTAATATPFDRR